MNRSPFADTRFEYEVRHLYYIQDDLYATLEKAKPCFLIGSRGTGKTTLLRSLSWRERSTNLNLRSRLGMRSIKRFVGVYIKLPDVQLDGISNWLSAEPVHIRRALYSRYLELIQLQEIFDAVSELGASGELEYHLHDEGRLVKSLLDDYGPELHHLEASVRRPSSFADLSKSVRRLRRIVERASQQDINPLEILEALGSPTQLCAMSRDIAGRIVKILAGDDSEPPFIKVCFDEAETLDSFGVEVLNSWVRLANGPLLHVISFVSRPESLSQTLLPNLTVQSADVEFLDLDMIKDKQFKAFAEGVAALRLREFAKVMSVDSRSQFDDIPSGFSTDKLFGKLNLNFLLEDALKESVSPFAKNLLAQAYSAAGKIEDAGKSRKGDDSALPIYETYIAMKTDRDLPSDDEPRWSKRRISSQLTRKSMIAAYLSIMNELRTSPRYAYADMILQVSDSCIRDFLNNLEYIFREAKLSLSQFLHNVPVKPTIQHAGLLAASKAKMNSLPTHGVNHPSSTAKLILGLGALTAMLQSRSSNGKHLKTTERGIFHIDVAQGGQAAQRATQLVIEAAEAGFLKVVENGELKLEFRVHTSLAPAYGFSYRGAYYPVQVTTVELLAFADAHDDREIDKLVQGLFNRLDGAVTSDLFGAQ